MNNYTVRNVPKFKNFSCYKGNVKFDDSYDVFVQRYLTLKKMVSKTNYFGL